MAKIASRKTCGCPKDRLLIGAGTVSRGPNKEIECGRFKCIEGPKTIDFVVVRAEFHKAHIDESGKVVKRTTGEPIKSGENR